MGGNRLGGGRGGGLSSGNCLMVSFQSCLLSLDSASTEGMGSAFNH